MKLEFSRQIFEKTINIKFYETPFSGSRVVPYGRTDIKKLTVAFRNFAKAPKTENASLNVKYAFLVTIKAKETNMPKLLRY
jgi:hypothetical protein